MLYSQVHNAANSNQKEKYEADLKKEIKKLQVTSESVVNGASFHSVSSRFLNALTVGAETKFTGRAFHKFTTRCVKKCLRTSSLDRPFSSLSW